MKREHIFESPVIASSGLMGLVGEGYWYHKVFKILLPLLFSFKWITFQTKTMTAMKKIGNMKLKEDGITPVELKSKCIHVNIWKGFGVNNVSLPNEGVNFYLKTGILHEIENDLHLSIMLVSNDLEARLVEARLIVVYLKFELPRFRSKRIFLHWNISCPNTGHDAKALFLKNLYKEYEVLKELDLPIILKVGWNFPKEVILELQQKEMIFGIDAINTIPFDDLPDMTKKKYFKKDINGNYISPLDKYQHLFVVKGRGGVSANPIRPYALKWISEARSVGVTVPIIGGGGILWPWHVWQFKKAGATAISPGSIAFLRPFNLSLVTLTAKIIFRNH